MKSDIFQREVLPLITKDDKKYLDSIDSSLYLVHNGSTLTVGPKNHTEC